ERDVGITRARRDSVWREAVGIEAFGIAPQFAMTVHHPRHDRDKRTIRAMAAAGLIIRDGGAEHDRQRRIKAHRLADQAAEINETRKVPWGRRKGTEHGTETGMAQPRRGRES